MGALGLESISSLVIYQNLKIDFTLLLTRHEIKFHIAHVYEVRGDSHAKAKDLYEELLKETDISANLKADVFRQLGWMFHRYVLNFFS